MVRPGHILDDKDREAMGRFVHLTAHIHNHHELR